MNEFTQKQEDRIRQIIREEFANLRIIPTAKRQENTYKKKKKKK